MTHEAQMHSASCMLTLTYDDDHLPLFGQLVKRDLQLFLKRLRKAGFKFKYVASGEYGDENGRPHFHLALFGVDFGNSRRIGGRSSVGRDSWISDVVSTYWGNGNHQLDELTFETCAYIARYILKKQKGPGAEHRVLHTYPDGQLVVANPPFMVMSKGIGRTWFREYFMSDVFPHAAVITRDGKKLPVPRFYKTLLKEVGEDLSLDMQYRSTVRSELESERRFLDNMPHRRRARAIVSEAGVKRARRNLQEFFMLKAIVCVKDRAADVFNQPWFVPHRNVAVRDFTDEVNRVAQDNPLNKHPDDYDLYFLGNYNDAAGSFDLEPSPVILVRGKDVAAS